MTVRVKARERGVATVAAFAVLIAIGAPLVTLLHLDHLPVNLCMFKVMTGLPCATCGTTRAIGSLGRLDLAGALSVNPLATVVMLTLLVWGVTDIVLRLRGRSLSLDLGPGEGVRLVVIFLVLAVANWAYLIAAGI
jgi:hypothetical protein